MPNTDTDRLAALLEKEYGCKRGMVHEGYGAECASVAHARALYRTFGCDHSAHVAAVLTEAGVGFVAEAERERDEWREAAHDGAFQQARAERAEAALADLRARVRALADEWERKQVAYTPRGTANALRTLLEVDRPSDPLPLHRTEAGYPRCSTCDGGGCPDCTDPS